MIHEKISNVSMVLRDMGGQVNEDVWIVLRQAAIVLDASAEAVKNLENLLPIAGTGEAAQDAPARA